MPLETAKRTPLPLLVIFCLVPLLQTTVSIYWEWHTAITYPGLKAAMLIIPIVVWLRLRRRGVDLKDRIGWKRTNMRSGLWVGGLMSAAIVIGYYAALRKMIDPAPLVTKLRTLGVVEYYWIMAVFISLWNSLLEEYYWRAFIIGELRSWVQSIPVLCVLGGGLFGLHHLFILLPLFEWPLVLLCMVGIMTAGGVWSWMRLRGGSILDCYISHVLVDLSIMWVGYDLVRSFR